MCILKILLDGTWKWNFLKIHENIHQFYILQTSGVHLQESFRQEIRVGLSKAFVYDRLSRIIWLISDTEPISFLMK